MDGIEGPEYTISRHTVPISRTDDESTKPRVPVAPIRVRHSRPIKRTDEEEEDAPPKRTFVYPREQKRNKKQKKRPTIRCDDSERFKKMQERLSKEDVGDIMPWHIKSFEKDHEKSGGFMEGALDLSGRKSPPPKKSVGEARSALPPDLKRRVTDQQLKEVLKFMRQEEERVKKLLSNRQYLFIKKVAGLTDRRVDDYIDNWNHIHRRVEFGTPFIRKLEMEIKEEPIDNGSDRPSDNGSEHGTDQDEPTGESIDAAPIADVVRLKVTDIDDGSERFVVIPMRQFENIIRLTPNYVANMEDIDENGEIVGIKREKSAAPAGDLRRESVAVVKVEHLAKKGYLIPLMEDYEARKAAQEAMDYLSNPEISDLLLLSDTIYAASAEALGEVRLANPRLQSANVQDFLWNDDVMTLFAQLTVLCMNGVTVRAQNRPVLDKSTRRNGEAINEILQKFTFVRFYGATLILDYDSMRTALDNPWQRQLPTQTLSSGGAMNYAPNVGMFYPKFPFI